MGTKIDITLLPLVPDEVDAEVGAVGRVIDHETGRDLPLVIPTGPSAGVKSIDLDPGEYTIEARLPSGSLARQHVQVTNQSHIPVQFTDQMFGLSSSNKMSGLESLTVREKVWTLEVSRLYPGCWKSLAELARARVAPTMAEIADALEPTSMTEVDASQTRGDSRYRWRRESDDYSVQVIAVVERPGIVELVPLPIPWRSRRGTPAEVEICVPRDARSPLAINVRDPDFGVMVSYLGAGAIEDAHKVLESNSRWSAIQSLQDKLENPFAASIAGCALVLSETSGQIQHWDGWLDTLVSAFDHLPDAAIVHATRLLRRVPPDPVRAREQLMRASMMGVPIFAPVAKLFLDGLTTLVSDAEFDSQSLDEDLFKAVRIVMMRVQPGQPVTVIRLGRANG